MNQAVILAAGNSSRLYPFATTLNKALVAMLDQTLVERTIDLLVSSKIKEIFCVIVQSQKAEWEALLKRKYSSLGKIELIIQESAEGMGDALLQAAPFLKDDFLVIFPYHYKEVFAVNALVEADGPAIIYSERNEPSNYGVVRLNDTKSVLLGIEEKPETKSNSSIVVEGIYRLNDNYLRLLRTCSGHYSFEEALNSFASQISVAAIEIPDTTLTLKYPWHLLDHMHYLLSSQQNSQNLIVGKSVIIDESNGPVHIDKTAKIGDFTILRGPLFIGKNVIIGDHCLIRDSSIEHDCTVGAYTELARSLVFAQTKIHFSYVADSIIGPSCSIGAGLLTTNKRLDRRTILVTVGEKRVNSKRRNLGIMVGEHSVFGSRVMSMPGAIVTPHSQVMPGDLLK